MNIFLNGCYGACNLGDDIMMDIVIRDIKKIFDTNVVFNIRSKGNSTCHIDDPNIHYIHQNRYEEVLAIKKSNYYIWGGGTFLYENKDNGFKSIFSIFLHLLLARLFRSKIIFYSIGYGPFLTKKTAFLAKLMIRMSDFITARDEISYHELFKINPNTIYTEDLVYRLNVTKNITKKSSDIIDIVINSVYYSSTLELEQFSNFIIQTIEKIKKTNSKIMLHFIAAWDSNDNSDTKSNLKLLNLLQDKMPFDYKIYSQIDKTAIISLIQNSKIVIAHRLHILLIATLFDKEIYTLAYHSKVTKFLAQINYHNGKYEKNLINMAIDKSNQNFTSLKTYLKK